MAKPKQRKAGERAANEAAAARKWQVVVIPKVVRCEGRDFLTKGQYLHVADFVSQLVGFGSKLYDPTMKIEQIGEFWELKEKWGVLGRINVRVYFAYIKERNEIAVLHAYNKRDDGATPGHVILRIKMRLNMYLRGELDDDATRIEVGGGELGLG